MPDSPTRPDEFAIRMSNAPESPHLSVDDGLSEPMPKRSDCIELSYLSGDHEVQRDFCTKSAWCAARSSGAGPSTVIPSYGHLCSMCPLEQPYFIAHFDIVKGVTFGGGDEGDDINKILQILRDGDVEAPVAPSSPRGTAGIHQPVHTIKIVESLWKLAGRVKCSSVSSEGDSAQMLLDLRGKLKRQEIGNIDPASCSSNHEFPGKHYYGESLKFLANDILKTMAEMRGANLDTFSNSQEQKIYVSGDVDFYQDLLNELLQDSYRS